MVADLVRDDVRLCELALGAEPLLQLPMKVRSRYTFRSFGQ